MSASPDRKPVVVLVRPQLGENIGKAAICSTIEERAKDCVVGLVKGSRWSG